MYVHVHPKALFCLPAAVEHKLFKKSGHRLRESKAFATPLLFQSLELPPTGHQNEC